MAAAEDKGGLDCVVLDVASLLGIADLFVIVTGANTRQIRTIVEEVEARVRALHGVGPQSVEGLETLEWVLMDYGDFVVHVFASEARRFYDLDRLWGDAPRLELTTNGATSSGSS